MWVVIWVLVLIGITGAFLVWRLPEPMQISGWTILVVLLIVVAAAGFVWVGRGDRQRTARYIWSRIG